MKSLITLPSNQLTQLKNNEQVMLCVPLAEQPDKNLICRGLYADEEGNTSIHFDNKNRDYGHSILLQYPVGKVLGVREKAKSIALRGLWIDSDLHVKVVDNSVKRVSEVKRWEIIKMFPQYGPPNSYNIMKGHIHGAFANWFNAKYAKPRPRREKGKIVRYECWIYAVESIARIIYRKPIMRRIGILGETKILSDCEGYKWKNLPLEIHVKPLCEFPVIELEAK